MGLHQLFIDLRRPMTQSGEKYFNILTEFGIAMKLV
jgi:hypothetical protein